MNSAIMINTAVTTDKTVSPIRLIHSPLLASQINTTTISPKMPRTLKIKNPLREAFIVLTLALCRRFNITDIMEILITYIESNIPPTMLHTNKHVRLCHSASAMLVNKANNMAHTSLEERNAILGTSCFSLEPPPFPFDEVGHILNYGPSLWSNYVYAKKV